MSRAGSSRVIPSTVHCGTGNVTVLDDKGCGETRDTAGLYYRTKYSPCDSHESGNRYTVPGTNSKLPVETLQQENTSSHLIQTRIDDGLWILLCMPCNRILSL